MGIDNGMIGEDESLFLYGCSSMMVLKVVGELEREFGKGERERERERGELLEHPTLRRLGEYFLRGGKGTGEEEEGEEEKEVRRKEKEMEWFPLTDSQERIYRWECLNGGGGEGEGEGERRVGTAAYTMQYRWKVGRGGRGIEREVMEEAVGGLMDSIPLLRAEFSDSSSFSAGGKGLQRVRRREDVKVPLVWVEESIEGEEVKKRGKEMGERFAREVSGDVFSIFSPPLFRVYVFNVINKQQQQHQLLHQELIINIHHLLLDDLSARIVFQRLSDSYAHILRKLSQKNGFFFFFFF